jgi:hypothetical protein
MKKNRRILSAECSWHKTLKEEKINEIMCNLNLIYIPSHEFVRNCLANCEILTVAALELLRLLDRSTSDEGLVSSKHQTGVISHH